MDKNTEKIHRIFTSSDNYITFKDLVKAQSAYATPKHRILVEDIGHGKYLIYSRLLTGPSLAKNDNEVFKVVGSLL